MAFRTRLVRSAVLAWTRPLVTAGAIFAAIFAVHFSYFVIRLEKIRKKLRHLARQLRSYYADYGYVLIPNGVANPTLQPGPVDTKAGEAVLQTLIAEVDAARPELSKGGYRIWSPRTELPAALREWSDTSGVALVQWALPEGSKNIRCIGGAALLKRPGEHKGTPFHQDGAYASEEGSVRHGKKVCALWLALSASNESSGCLRFAPSLGFSLLPHERTPRETAQDGFENSLAPKHKARAEREAHSRPVQPGDVIIIGSQVVHGSHAAEAAERVAFSPLFEYE